MKKDHDAKYIHCNRFSGEVEKISKERTYKVRVRGTSYEVVLHPDLENGGYWVECPALPGCASQGDTVKEALEMIKDAIKGHFEVMAEGIINVTQGR
ncbi:MAG: type II toxin-antitoxin system HicB family antitoxin [Thermodesulfobacteriota bacterium]